MKWLAGLGALGLLGVGLMTVMFFAMFGGGLETAPTAPLASVAFSAVPNQVLSAVQETGCEDLVALSAQVKSPGIDLNVCRAWFAQENGGGAGQPPFNYLFISCTKAPCYSLSGRDWAVYGSPGEGAQAIMDLLGTKLYAGIVASFGLDPLVQISAIGESPWCECRYRLDGGAPGSSLLRVYQGVRQALSPSVS